MWERWREEDRVGACTKKALNQGEGRGLGNISPEAALLSDPCTHNLNSQCQVHAHIT